ncbi:hypothetical protein D3C86_2022260 [compost metagenome]
MRHGAADEPLIPGDTRLLDGDGLGDAIGEGPLDRRGAPGEARIGAVLVDLVGHQPHLLHLPDGILEQEVLGLPVAALKEVTKVDEHLVVGLFEGLV